MKRNLTHVSMAWMGKRGLPMLAALLVLMTLSLGQRVPVAGASGLYSYDFEQGLKPWDAGAGSLLSLDRGDNFCPFEVGAQMALITMPVNGPGLLPARFGTNTAAFMGASFPVKPGESVVVDWMTKPEGTCNSDCDAVAYLGAPSDPTNIKWVHLKDTPGVFGWTQHHYAITMPGSLGDAAPAVYVALGVDRNSNPWYLGTALGVDCVRVNILSNN